jgi:hypothetical protein
MRRMGKSIERKGKKIGTGERGGTQNVDAWRATRAEEETMGSSGGLPGFSFTILIFFI